MAYDVPSLGYLIWTKNESQSRGKMPSDMNHFATKKHYEEHVWPYVTKHGFMEHDIQCNRKSGDRGIWYLDRYISDGYFHHFDGRNNKKK